MNSSSGIKRGLATTAVAALAVTGLPFLASSASAEPLTTGLGANAVDLVQPTTDISGKNDGQNTTVRLTALGGSNVTSVRFEYALNGVTFQNIGTATRNDDGAFSLEWDSTAIAGAPAVTLRATAVGPAAPDASSVDVDGPFASNNTLDTVNLDPAGAAGVFQAPYAGANGNFVIASGTTSSVNQNPDIQYYQSGAGQDTGTYAGTSQGYQSTAARGATTGSFKKAVDISGYNFANPNQLLLKATTTTDDAEAYTLYNQTITTVTATPDRTNVPNGQTTDVTVTVADQNGNPIYGARVSPSTGGGAAQFTDVNGEATFAQGGGTRFYYADATDAAGYQANLGDKRSDNVTVTEFAQTPTSFDADFADGKAFDLDEYQDGDITVTLVDQNGDPVAAPTGQNVQYYLVETPFDGSPATQRVPATGQATATPTANPGEYTIDYNAGAFTDPEGSYDLFVSLSPDNFGNNGIAASRVDTFKAGDAEITYGSDTLNGTAGGTVTATGTLALDDGTGLPGRRIALSYTSGDESGPGADATGDSVLVGTGTTGAAPATTRTVTTGADGSFTSNINDPAESPQPAELGGNLDAATANTTDDNGNTDNPGATNNGEVVNFNFATAPDGTTVRVDVNDGAANDRGGVSPGEFADGTVTVTTPGTAPGTTVPVGGVPVTLTVDGQSFFTDGMNQNNRQSGNLDNDGQSITVFTDSNGEATFNVSIARSPEFDDDGFAADTVTATSGSASDTDVFNSTSYSPLNGGAVRLDVNEVRTDAAGALPGQPVGNRVFFDVFTEDQFGNLVGDELVRLTDNTESADIQGARNNYYYGGAYTYSDFETDGDASATATQPVTQRILATWAAPGTNANGSPASPKTDSYTINWYDGSIANGTVTIESSPEGTVMTGSAVTETVTALDSAGNPIVGAVVVFTRQGPGDEETQTFNSTTDNNGEASYTFFGTTDGTANITATVNDGNASKTATDQVVFAGEPVPPTTPYDITATLSGKGKAAGNDVLRVTTSPNAVEGSNVNFFRLFRGGKRRLVATDTINDNGRAAAFIVDPNGRKVSRYVAVVRKNLPSRGDRSNRLRLR